ncbi:MAG TPA: AAA family ATPase [Pseudomonadales bacterium]|nr:AAA family ATPase [Pseudomonadales bacterium]
MSEEEDRWLAKLGLERDPFPESETPIDFFSRGGREKQMDMLADTAAGGRPLIAVIGESGVGKSTFFHALLRRLPAQTRVARVTAGVFLSAKALLQAIARAMGVDTVPEEASGALRARLHEALRALTAAGTPCVVMVDDAGELEGDALDELVQIAELAGPGAALRVILFAMPGIRAALERATAARRVDAIIEETMLDRYSLNELRGYVQYRLARAGLKGASPFSEDDYQEIFRRSGGLPGRANVVAARLLRTRRGGLGADKIKWIAGGVAAALVVGGLLILLFAGGDDPEAAAERPLASTPAATSSLRPRTDTPAASSASGAEPGAASVATDPGVAPALAGEWMPVPAAAQAAVAEAPATASATSASEPAVTAAPVEAVPASAGSAEERMRRELLAIPAGHYTLQVLVNSSAERTREWIAARPDSDRYRYYRRVRDGAPQYVTLYGDFADRAGASRASEKVGGYPRAMADVQGDL